ncbi:sodium:solute symporter family transporter [Candidatus Foliamicus sp.]
MTPNLTSILTFVLILGLSLLITWQAGRRTRSSSEFFAASHSVGGFSNGLAIAGDHVSAGTLLGVTAIIYTQGYDGLLYMTGGAVGYPLLMCLLAERLRNLGRYTFVDVLSARFREPAIRVLAATGTLVVAVLYLISQMVAGGALFEVLFGMPYPFAVALVGGLTVLYVSVGGMLATTWVQMTKAVLLMFSVLLLLALLFVTLGEGPLSLLESAARVHQKGVDWLKPGAFLPDKVSIFSFVLTGMVGMVGLPHLLMRFFTVPDAKQARRSAVFATGYIVTFSVLLWITGLGIVVLLAGNAEIFDAQGEIIGSSNMVIMHAARIVGGSVLLGFMASVAFATLLAVVCGLVLAAAAALAHDLYSGVLKQGRADDSAEVRASRISVVALGAIAVGLGILFQSQNVAYLTALGFTVAASVNTPALLAALFWRGASARGLLVGGWVGLIVSVALLAVSPAVWEGALGLKNAPFPWIYPGLFSIPAAILAIVVVSLTDQSPSAALGRQRYDALLAPAVLGRRGSGA